MKEEDTQNSDLNNPDYEMQPVPVQYVDRSNDEDTIDLIELATLLWRSKKTIGIVTILFFAIGIFHISTEPVEYISEAMLVKDDSDTSALELPLIQQFGGIGGQMSTTLGRGITTTLPEIIESIDFQMMMMNQEVTFAKYDTTMSLYHYFDQIYETPVRGRIYGFIKDYTLLLPVTLYQKMNHFYRLFVNLFKSNSNSTSAEVSSGQMENQNRDIEMRILKVSPHTLNIMGQISGRMSTESSGSLIEASFRLPDPVAATEANAIFIEQIQEFLINQRIEKARRNLEFSMTLSNEARERLNQASLNVARFVDANPGNLTAMATIELDRLMAEQERLSIVYENGLVKVEEARRNVQEDTPVFILFQKPLFPNSRDAISPLFLIGFLILGFTLGIFWVFTVKIYQTIKARITS